MARRLLISIAVLSVMAGAAVAPVGAGASTSWIHDGRYTSKAGARTANVKFTVVNNGTRVDLGTETSSPSSPVEGGVTCTAAASLVALNPTEFHATGPMTIRLYNFNITPSGSFSYSGNVSVGTSTTYGLPFSVSGHFIRGNIIGGRTIAAVGTFSAPQICSASTPTRFALVWK